MPKENEASLIFQIISQHKKINLPGQWRTKQTSELFPSPAQSFPSWAGAGLLHNRTRVLVPLPHVLLQVDQLSQADQFPSTRDNGEELNTHSQTDKTTKTKLIPFGRSREMLKLVKHH